MTSTALLPCPRKEGITTAKEDSGLEREHAGLNQMQSSREMHHGQATAVTMSKG